MRGLDTLTYRTTTVTLAHARRGLIIVICGTTVSSYLLATSLIIVCSVHFRIHCICLVVILRPVSHVHALECVETVHVFSTLFV